MTRQIVNAAAGAGPPTKAAGPARRLSSFPLAAMTAAASETKIEAVGK